MTFLAFAGGQTSASASLNLRLRPHTRTRPTERDVRPRDLVSILRLIFSGLYLGLGLE